MTDTQIISCAGAILFALAHAIDVRHGKLIVLLGLLSLSQVAIHHSDAGICPAHVLIDLNGAGVVLERLVVFAIPLRLLSERVLVGAFERVGGEGLGGSKTRGIRCGITQFFADVAGQFSDDRKHRVLVTRSGALRSDGLAGESINRFDRDFVAAVGFFDRSTDHDIYAFALRHQPGKIIIKRLSLGLDLPGDLLGLAPIIGGDE